MSKAETHISVTAIGLVKANGKNIRQEYQACTKSHEYEEEDKFIVTRNKYSWNRTIVQLWSSN